MTWRGGNDRAGSQQPSTSCRLRCAADGGGRFVRHNIVRALAGNQERGNESKEGFEARHTGSKAALRTLHPPGAEPGFEGDGDLGDQGRESVG